MKAISQKITFTIIIFILSWTISFGQTDSLKNNFNNDKTQSEIKIDLKEIKTDIEIMKVKYENYIYLLNCAFVFLGLILSIGLGSSLVSFYKNENRAKELFEIYKVDKAGQDNRSEEMYQMFLTDKQKNEKSAIETTEKTIALVNRTLELAVQASERSAKSLQIRLSNILKLIEDESINLVKKSGAFDDDKNLTLRREIQTEIHRIGNKIEGLENNLVILDQEENDKTQAIVLTPYATFIKGTDQFLKEQFNDAIKSWEQLLKNDFQGYEPVKLKSLTYYWIGYLNNNLARFKEGINNFNNAEKICQDSRKYELQRMQIETRFFSNEDSESIAEDLESLLKAINTDDSLSKIQKKNRDSKVLNTLGNVYYSIAKNTSQKDKKIIFFNKSKDIFLSVLNISNSSEIESLIRDMEKGEKDKQKWVIFGLAESLYHIDEEQKLIAKRLFNNEIIHLAEREYENREEKRTKVLAKTCQLISHYRSNPDDTDRLENDRAMLEVPLSDLNKDLTIYSQLVRKNVEYEEFKEHLKQIINKQA